MNQRGNQTQAHHFAQLQSQCLFAALIRIQFRICFDSLKLFAVGHSRARPKTIQQQFVQHCAIVIQSRFRGYLYRKRYRAFLPIYRRVRQLLLALYNGWKIRRIMKLPVMKSQIGDIKAKARNNQASSLRIAKRQFIDDIERLSKKGRWVDILIKSRATSTLNAFNGKQNSSLYGNVKSKSIRNIFKQPNTKKMKELHNHQSSRSSKLETLRKIDVIDCNPAAKITIISDFDEQPIKTQHAISFHDTQSQKIPVFSKRQYLKKGRRQQSVQNCIKTARIVNEKPKQAVGQKKIQQKSTNNNSADNENAKSMLSASRASKSSQVSRQKIHITISNPLRDSVASIKSIKQLDESTVDMKAMQASTSSISFDNNIQFLPELVQVYEKKYLREKMSIIQKLTQLPMKYTPASKKSYAALLLNF